MIKLSIVTTLYKSRNYINDFIFKINLGIENCKSVIPDLDYELIFVNDGSPDDSLEIIVKFAQDNDKIQVINFSRNFGHHYAIKAGLEKASGDYIFLIDSDLEENPELCFNFLIILLNDNNIDVVYGVQDGQRKGNFFERISGELFYKFLNLFSNINYPSNTLTARLMKKEYVKAVLQYTERRFDIWVLFILAGFNQVAYPTQKKHKGQTTYNLSRKISMGVETITQTSNKPLYFIFYLGVSIFLLSLFTISYTFINYLLNDMNDSIGWSSLIMSIWIVGGINLISIGIIAIYLSKIYTESKQRPSYIIKKIS